MAAIRQVGPNGIAPPYSFPSIVRCARAFGLKARIVTKDWSRLAATALPAIAQRKDGSFLILGKVADEKVLVQDPVNGRPQLMEREAFEAAWSGRLRTWRAEAPPEGSACGRRVDAASINPPWVIAAAVIASRARSRCLLSLASIPGQLSSEVARLPSIFGVGAHQLCRSRVRGADATLAS